MGVQTARSQWGAMSGVAKAVAKRDVQAGNRFQIAGGGVTRFPER